MFTEELREQLTQETPQVSYGALAALLNFMKGHGLCEMGEVLVNQNGLECT